MQQVRHREPEQDAESIKRPLRRLQQQVFARPEDGRRHESQQTACQQQNQCEGDRPEVQVEAFEFLPRAAGSFGAPRDLWAVSQDFSLKLQ